MHIEKTLTQRYGSSTTFIWIYYNNDSNVEYTEVQTQQAISCDCLSYFIGVQWHTAYTNARAGIICQR